MTIRTGFVLPREQRLRLYYNIRRALPGIVWEVNLTGHRVLIAQDKASEMARGLIHKPASTVRQEQREAGAGYIIAVGPMVGQPGAPHPVGLECTHPADLLGAHCYHASWTGKVFRTDEADEEFDTESHLVIMTDRDIQALDHPAAREPDDLEEGERNGIERIAREQGLL